MATRTSRDKKWSAFLKSQLRVLRKKLLDCKREQKKLRNRLSEKEKLSFGTAHATVVIDEGSNLGLLSQCVKLIPELQVAIQIIEQTPNKYGTCERCRRKMSYKRLMAIPWARYCRKCQKKKES